MATAYPFEVTYVPAPEWMDVAQKALEDINEEDSRDRSQDKPLKERSVKHRA